jgi:transposase
VPRRPYQIDVLQRVGEHPASRAYELPPRLWKSRFPSNSTRSAVHIRLT